MGPFPCRSRAVLAERAARRPPCHLLGPERESLRSGGSLCRAGRAAPPVPAPGTAPCPAPAAPSGSRQTLAGEGWSEAVRVRRAKRQAPVPVSSEPVRLRGAHVGPGGREVGSVGKGLHADAAPLGGWQGTWPRCWHRAVPVTAFTKASQTASSSWGKTWPRMRRWMASSCRGCAESVGEYSPAPGHPRGP